MFDWLAAQGARELVPLVSVVGGILFVTIVILAGQWAAVRRAEFKARVREAELALKQEMIERGMSADDVVRVVDAGQKKSAKDEEQADEQSAASS